MEIQDWSHSPREWFDKYVKEEVSEPEEAEAKEKHRKDMIRAQRIIADSIKDHLIPQVSSKKTPK